MKEATVIKNFKSLLKSWIPGAIIEKINQGPFSSRGIPDLIIMMFGRTAMLEAKSESGRLTDIQKAMLDKMSKVGGFVGILRGTGKSFTFEITNYKTGSKILISKETGQNETVKILREFLNDPKKESGSNAV